MKLQHNLFIGCEKNPKTSLKKQGMPGMTLYLHLN